jgi:hypothetical protein
MPNYVHCKLTCKGASPDLQAFKALISSEERVFDFQNIIPMLPFPSEENLPIPRWYLWRLDHWNTKSNALWGELEEDDGQLHYFFKTVWTPPIPIFAALAKMFPTIYFICSFDEESGEIIEDVEYNKPEGEKCSSQHG